MYWPVTKTVGQPGIPGSHPYPKKIRIGRELLHNWLYKALVKMQTTELVIDQDFFFRSGS